MAMDTSNLSFSGQTGAYHGKVRDVYYFDDKVLLLASDRISAFDHILPRPIPHKGAVLTGVATYFLKATSDLVPNWLESVPQPNSAFGVRCEPIKIEMVIRGYLAGHAWREYKSGKRILCGVQMPDGMKESDRFPSPIITPATKADEGHDEDIAREDILSRGLVDEGVYKQLEAYTQALFERGTQMAQRQGLILVDTKYEFGIHDGTVYLIDEVHTPDSSRYYIADGFGERQAKGEKQQQLSKEFVREWLMENGFQGLEGQQMPAMPEEFVELVSERYIDLYERLTGAAFDRNLVPSERELKSAVSTLLEEGS
ncbi:MAG: phosphoribosylaminoimidazolesuccinocarboxamide synthase [Saprospiraceae bacterium]